MALHEIHFPHQQGASVVRLTHDPKTHLVTVCLKQDGETHMLTTDYPRLIILARQLESTLEDMKRNHLRTIKPNLWQRIKAKLQKPPTPV